MKNIFLFYLLSAAFTFLFPETDFAQIPNVGPTLANFVFFTNAGAVGNTGSSVINGNIGSANGGAITGFGGTNGNIVNDNTVLTQCTTELASLVDQINLTPNTNTNHTPAFGLGETVGPGVYYIDGAGSVGGTLILDGESNPNALFIFKFNGAFTTGAGAKIILINGAKPCNVFWLASGGAVAMAAGTEMQGTLISNPGAVSMAAGGKLLGRMLSAGIGGAVTVDNVTATVSCQTCDLNIWIGNDNVWNKTTNWCGGIPTATTNVQIPALLNNYFYPQLTTGSALANNISIATGASLTISGSGILNLSGAITNNGVLDLKDGTIELAGTSGAQSIAGSMFKDSSVKNLKISNNASLATITTPDTLKLTGFLTFGASDKTFTTNGNLTLISNAAGTASIADRTNNGANSGDTIIGNVNVERYIAAGRKWRFLSPNTLVGSGSTNSINATWMEGQGTTPGYGIWITGSGAGFDPGTNTPSMKYWDAATQNYVGVTNPTLFDIRSRPAYMTFVRGDRSATSTNSPTTTPTVVRTYGKLAQGTISGGTADNVLTNITAFGNPYASAVDLTKLNYGVANPITIYVWDPNLGGSYGLGAFQTLTSSGPGMDFDIIPGGGSYGMSTVMNTLESGQAFFVGATGSPRTIDFPEVSKTPKAHDVFFTPGQEQKVSSLLYLNNAGVFTLVDGAVSKMHQSYNTAVDFNDAFKLVNTSENVAVKRGAFLLAVEYRNLPMPPLDTIQFSMTGMRLKDYRWNFTLTNVDAPGVTALLKDRFLNTSTVLNQAGQNFYDFSVTSAVGSFAPDRFLIVFQQGLVLPVTLAKISAARQADETVNVKWDVENEMNISRYEIQRSSNGNSFTTLDNATAINNSGGSASYNYTDDKPLSGVNFYRIKAISSNERIQYSSIVKVAGNDKKETIFVYPNPLKGREISIAYENKKAGAYNLRLVNKAGQTIHRSTVNLSSSNEVNKIRLSENIAAGSYQVIITSPDGKREVQALIVL